MATRGAILGRDLAVGPEYLPGKPEKQKSRWIGVPEIVGKWYHEAAKCPGLPAGTPAALQISAVPKNRTQEMLAKYGS